MNVLLVSWTFPPGGGGGAFRPAMFVKYALRAGCGVHVLTTEIGRGAGDGHTDDSLLEDVRGATVTRTGRIPLSLPALPLRRKGAEDAEEEDADDGERAPGVLRRAARGIRGALAFPDPEIGWLPFALRRGMEIIRRGGIDVIYATSPPPTALLAGSLLARWTGVPLVAELRDPWSPFPEWRAGRPCDPASARCRREARLERSVLARARTVVVVNDAVASLYRSAFPELDPERIAVVQNGYDAAGFPADDAPAPDPCFSILFAGSYYGYHGPGPFLRALDLALEREPALGRHLRLQLAGSRDRAVRRELRRFREAGLVTELGYLPHREATERIRRSALLLLTLPDLELSRCWVPAKSYEYLASGRPILAVVPDGVLRGMLSGHPGVQVVGPGDPSAVADALLREFRAWCAGARGPVQRDLSGVPTRERMASALLDVLRDASARPSTHGK
ncbi:MAG TPA: glycosyltransferase [Longimicrobium sp.]